MGKKYTNFTINLDGLEDKEQWYGIITNFNYEQFVIDRLNILNTNMGGDAISEIFTPIQEIKSETTNAKGIKKTKIKIEKLMPSYVFIKTKLNTDMWTLLMNTTGIRCIMCTSGVPSMISESEISKMKNLNNECIA